MRRELEKQRSQSELQKRTLAHSQHPQHSNFDTTEMFFLFHNKLIINMKKSLERS